MIKKYLIIITSTLFIGNFATYASELSQPVIGDKFNGTAWVIDGDSLRITRPNLTKVEVRLFGIDAPELKTTRGKKSKSHMIRLIKYGKRVVNCTVIDIDHYNRRVSICKNANGDLAETMMKNGHARIFRKFLHKAKSDELINRYTNADKIGKKKKNKN